MKYFLKNSTKFEHRDCLKRTAELDEILLDIRPAVASDEHTNEHVSKMGSSAPIDGDLNRHTDHEKGPLTIRKEALHPEDAVKQATQNGHKPCTLLIMNIKWGEQK